MIVLKTTETTLECQMKTESMCLQKWIRETGSGPPTHARANSEPAESRAPPKALASPARSAPHTDEFGSLGPELSRIRTCTGIFRPLGYRTGVYWDYIYEIFLLCLVNGNLVICNSMIMRFIYEPPDDDLSDQNMYW
jgi:hypothetical protein